MQDVFGDDGLTILGDVFAASTSRVAGSPELAFTFKAPIDSKLRWVKGTCCSRSISNRNP